MQLLKSTFATKTLAFFRLVYFQQEFGLFILGPYKNFKKLNLLRRFIYLCTD